MKNETRRISLAPNSTPDADDTRDIFIDDINKVRVYALNQGTAAVTVTVTYVDPQIDDAFIVDNPGIIEAFGTMAAIAAGTVDSDFGTSAIQSGAVAPARLRINAITADVADQPIDILIVGSHDAR